MDVVPEAPQKIPAIERTTGILNHKIFVSQRGTVELEYKLVSIPLGTTA
jgi:hypothetical protein